MNTLANEIIEDRSNFKELSDEKDDKIPKLDAEVSKLKEKLDEVRENLEVEKEKREIAEIEKDRVQKIVEEL